MIKTYILESGVKLESAILVYQQRDPFGTESHFATVHAIDMESQRPALKEGTLISKEQTMTFMKSLVGSASTVSWVDPCTLAVGADRIVWYTPPMQQSMFFQTSAHLGNRGVQGQGQLALPGLVWMSTAEGQLYIYATAVDGRPMKDTVLYQAPLFNVWSQGKVCQGSANAPNGDLRLNPEAWQRFFFGSYFTHPNFTEPGRLMKADPVRYWAGELKRPRKRFPLNKLVELPLKVVDLLTATDDSLRLKLKRVTGEF